MLKRSKMTLADALLISNTPFQASMPSLVEAYNTLHDAGLPGLALRCADTLIFLREQERTKRKLARDRRNR